MPSAFRQLVRFRATGGWSAERLPTCGVSTPGTGVETQGAVPRASLFT
ncbi:hypothetical protein [Halorussus caseinilyticus]|nr:hypothetical protein [Halorussus sp. DT72]